MAMARGDTITDWPNATRDDFVSPVASASLPKPSLPRESIGRPIPVWSSNPKFVKYCANCSMPTLVPICAEATLHECPMIPLMVSDPCALEPPWDAQLIVRLPIVMLPDQ